MEQQELINFCPFCMEDNLMLKKFTRIGSIEIRYCKKCKNLAWIDLREPDYWWIHKTLSSRDEVNE